MVVSEWPKLPALHAGIGAFRHGFIETVTPGLGTVVFAAPGPTAASAHALAYELSGYGANVLVVQNGETNRAPAAQPVDEFLSPILDMIPVQLFADEMATRLNVPPGFRYISKVVTQL
jgi:fructoselysine-6-P-deglycase FrlB-like protein